VLLGEILLFDAHSAVKEAIAAMINRAGICVVSGDDIKTRAYGYEASSAIAIAHGIDAFAVADAIRVVIDRQMIETVTVNNGHLCFTLTDEALIALAQKSAEGGIPSNITPPPLEDARRIEEYAYMRMRMFARKPGRGIPHSPSIRGALWLSLGMVEALNDKRLLKRRLTETAKAAITIDDSTSFIKKELYGEVCRCICAMLYVGITGVADS